MRDDELLKALQQARREVAPVVRPYPAATNEKMLMFQVDWDNRRLVMGVETKDGPMMLLFTSEQCRQMADDFMKFALDLKEGKGVPPQ